MAIQAQRPLKIGYLWQYETVDMARISASVLHVRSVRHALEKRGHQVRLLTFHHGQLQWTDDLQQWHRVERSDGQARMLHQLVRLVRRIQGRLHLPFLRLFDSLHFAQACRSALADCDLFYERYWLMAYGGLVAAKQLGIPLIYEVNGDLVEEYAQLGIELSPAQWRVLNVINRQMFLGAARIVTVSDTLRQKTIQRWRLPERQVCVVDNGAEVDLFAAAATNGNRQHVQEVAARFHLNGQPTIMFVGSFKPWHGLELLLEAFRTVAAQDAEATLALVGDGPMRPALEEQMAAWQLQARTRFTGKVPHLEVAALLSKAAITVVNPRVSAASAAQSPLKLFEYMAAGKAIVAPAVPNVERILEHGRTGWLVPPNDPAALADALLTLLADEGLRQQLGAAAKAAALAHHSWDNAAAKLEALMGECLCAT